MQSVKTPGQMDLAPVGHIILTSIFFSPLVSYKERMVQSLMQRHQAVRLAERAAPTRHVPTQLWRCSVVCWWCYASHPPGWVPLRWSSWPTSPSPVPSSSPGSAATGTSSSSPSTTLGMWLPRETSRPPYRSSGSLRSNYIQIKTDKVFMCSIILLIILSN